MINTIFFGIDLIMIYVAWSYFLKKSILDHYRDKLFDLREEIRRFYIDNDIPLTDQTYKSLRDLLNSHLRFTEDKSLIRVVLFLSEIEKDKELCDYITGEVEKQFSTENKKLQGFINKSREKASNILFGYMISSSPTMILLFVLTLIVMVFCVAIDFFKHRAKKDIARIKRKIMDGGKSLERYSLIHFGNGYPIAH